MRYRLDPVIDPRGDLEVAVPDQPGRGQFLRRRFLRAVVSMVVERRMGRFMGQC